MSLKLTLVLAELMGAHPRDGDRVLVDVETRRLTIAELDLTAKELPFTAAYDAPRHSEWIRGAEYYWIEVEMDAEAVGQYGLDRATELLKLRATRELEKKPTMFYLVPNDQDRERQPAH